LSADDEKLDELLAGGLLGGPQYDRILDRVMARSDARPPRRTTVLLRWAVAPGFAAATAVAVAWLVIARPARDPFTPKGTAAGVASGVLEMGCGPSGRHVCRMGDTLMFAVNAALASGVLGAYAERVDDPAHDRIWYFPATTAAAPAVAPGKGTVVVPEGIRIGPEHRPGRYRVIAWIASRSLGRAEVDAPASAGLYRSRAILELEVRP
jgi:hypothetical protein